MIKKLNENVFELSSGKRIYIWICEDPEIIVQTHEEDFTEEEKDELKEYFLLGESHVLCPLVEKLNERATVS